MPRVPFDADAQNEKQWAEMRKRLVKDLPTLEHREFRLIGSQADPSRYVLLFRSKDDVLVGECSASLIDGGGTNLTPEQQARILDLGWGAPSAARDDRPNYRVFWEPTPERRRRRRLAVLPGIPKPKFLATEDAEDAAQLVEHTLRGPLEVLYQGDLSYEHGHPDGSRRERRKRKSDVRWQKVLHAIEFADRFTTEYRGALVSRSVASDQT